MPYTSKESKILSNYNTNLVVTFLLLAICYIPASWATFIVREKEIKAKHQQMVSGVSVTAYWLSNWIWDNLSYQPTVWMFIILITSFPNTETLSSGGALGVVFGLLILFGSAMTSFTYFLSYFFTSPAGAQVAIIFITLVLGLILSIVGLILRSLPVSHVIYLHAIRHLFSLFPPFALGDALNNLTLIDQWSFAELKGGSKYNVHDWEISGLNLTFLAWETVAYLIIVILYEYISVIPSVQTFFSSYQNNIIPITDNKLKDDDVLEEGMLILICNSIIKYLFIDIYCFCLIETRVLTEDAQKNSTILVKDLKKLYTGGKYAVKGVSLDIPNGEVFGLLGVSQSFIF